MRVALTKIGKADGAETFLVKSTAKENTPHPGPHPSEGRASRHQRLQWGASLLALTAAYYLAGKFGLSLAFVNASASAVWPPTGMALAVLLLFGYRLWPGIFAGAFLVNLTTQGSVATSLGIAAGNTLEALVAAGLVGHLAGGRRFFQQGRTIFKFILLASVLSTMVSATVGLVTLGLGGYVHGDKAGPVWLTWWLGDMVSSLLIAPLLVIWGSREFPRWNSRRLLEGALLIVAILLTGQLVFLKPFSKNLPLEYVAVFPLLWAAFRFGPGGALTGAFLTSGLALGATLQGLGPFATPDPNASLLLLQAFIGTLTTTTLILAAVISERKRAEQRLQVQDAVRAVLVEARTLVEATPKILQALCTMAGWEVGAIWSISRESRELACLAMWNDPSVRIPQFEGMTRQLRFAPGVGLPGRVWNSGQPVWIPDVPQDLNFPRAALAAKEGLHAGLCFPLKRGEEILGVIECFSNRVRQPDEHFLQMLASIGNQIGEFIERRHSEETVRHQESQLRLVTDFTPVMLAQCSRDGYFRFVNRAYGDHLGLTPDQIIGKSLLEIMGAKALAAIQPYVDTVLQGTPIEYELEVPYQRIGPRLMRVSYVPERAVSGEVIGWLASLNDITERKRAEEAHQRIETLQGAILNSALDCIITIDQAGRVIEFNAAAERTFGRTRASVLGQSMAELIIPARLREQHRRGLARYLATGQQAMLGKRIEISALRADGSEFPVELSINVVRLGTAQAFTATLRDITERKKTEAALEEAQAQLKAHADNLEMVVAERTEELRETIAEIESFSYSISHDMRGPLRAMHGYAAILEEELKGKINNDQWSYLGRIVHATARLNQLVQGILSYSQISRSKLPLAPVDLQALIGEMKQHQPQLQPPGVDLQVEGPLPVVLGHETALLQIFSNLLGNAAKFVPSGTTPRIVISAEAAGPGLVRIWVADNGIGIDPKNFERIFQMFEQVNNPKDYEGTGIGLAIVRKAVERLGGKIGVVSSLGQGARFWFDLRRISD